MKAAEVLFSSAWSQKFLRLQHKFLQEMESFEGYIFYLMVHL